jgi:hypothetical protein
LDPLASSYPHNSPYAFSENRVIDGVELEGLEWSSIKTTDADGTVRVHYTVKIKVYTASEVVKDINVIKSKLKSIERMIEADFNKIDGSSSTIFTMDVQFSEQVETFEEEKDISNEFAMVLIDKNEEVYVDPITGKEMRIFVGGSSIKGQTQKNRINLAISRNGVIRSTKTMSRTASHELGHTANLPHAWEEKGTRVEVPESEEFNNLMNSAENLTASRRSSSGRDLNDGQLQEILFTVERQEATVEKK